MPVIPRRRRKRASKDDGPDPASGCRTAQFCLKCGNARLQRLVFLARQPRHVLDGLELLALDDIEVAQDFFGLIADDGVDLAFDAWAAPAASFISRPISSKNRLLVWVIPQISASLHRVG